MPRGIYKRIKPPWNKGKKEIYSQETKEKMRDARLGRVGYWNNKKRGSFSKEWREKIGKSMVGRLRPEFSGKNHPNWKGGISFEPYSVDWTETLRRSIRERDHYICQLCSQYGNTVHHIDYIKLNCNPNNLITLCRKCNTKVNRNRDYWIKFFNK